MGSVKAVLHLVRKQLKDGTTRRGRALTDAEKAKLRAKEAALVEKQKEQREQKEHVTSEASRVIDSVEATGSIVAQETRNVVDEAKKEILAISDLKNSLPTWSRSSTETPKPAAINEKRELEKERKAKLRRRRSKLKKAAFEAAKAKVAEAKRELDALNPRKGRARGQARGQDRGRARGQVREVSAMFHGLLSQHAVML